MDPNSGRLYENPEKHLVGQRHLIEVAHPNFDQRKRKSAKRNENCPCGSGKKFKKCCMHKEYL